MSGSEASQLLRYARCVEYFQSSIAHPHLLEQNLAAALKTICELFGTTIRGTLSYRTMTGRLLCFVYLDGRVKPGSVEESDHGLIKLARATRKEQYFSDLRINPPEGYTIYDPTIRSEVAVPVLFGKRVVSVIDIASARADAFSTKDINWLRQLASLIRSILIRPDMRFRTELASGESIADLLSILLRVALEITGILDMQEGEADLAILAQGWLIDRKTSLTRPGRTLVERGAEGINIPLRDATNQGDTFQVYLQTQSGCSITFRAFFRYSVSSLSRGNECIAALTISAPSGLRLDEDTEQALNQFVNQSAMIIHIAQTHALADVERATRKSLASLRSKTCAMRDSIIFWTPSSKRVSN